MIKNRRQCVIYGILFLFVFSTAIFPDNAYESVTVASSSDSAPYYFQDEEQRPIGIFIDLWNLWSEKTGIEVKFLSVSWSETIEAVKTGKADIHAGLFFSDDRDTFLDYSAPLITGYTHFFIHKTIFNVSRFSELMPFRIGLIKGDFAEQYVKENLPGATIQLYSNNVELFKGVENGEVRVFVKDTPIALYHLAKLKLLSQYKYIDSKPLYSNVFYSAVKEGNDTLRILVEKGFNMISDEEKSEIERRWMGTSSEKEDVIIALARDYTPFSMLNFKGEPVGLFVDFWRLWADKTGKKIDFRIYDWANTLESLKNDEVDIHSGLFRSSDRMEWIDFSQPFYQVASAFFYNIKYVSESDFDTLEDRKIGAVEGSFQAQNLRDNFANNEIILYPSTQVMIEAAIEEEIHIFYNELPVSLTILERLGAKGLFNIHKRNMIINTIHAGVIKDDLNLLASVDAGFNAITHQELAEVEKHWITNPDLRQLRDPIYSIRFTTNEEQWLESHRNIRLGIHTKWLPFDYVNSNGDHLGISSGYVEYLNNLLDIKMEPAVWSSWNSVLESIKKKEIDVLPCVVKMPELEEYMNFSSPYLTSPIVIVTRDDSSYVKDLEDLKSRKITVWKDNISHTIIKQNYLGLNPVPVDSIESGLITVSSNKADAFVGNLASISSIIKSKGLSNLKIAATTDYTVDICFGVREDWPAMVDILNKSIKSMTEIEKNEIYDDWMILKYEYGVNWPVVWRILIGILCGAVILFTIIIIWNRRLTREITQRIQVEGALQNAKEDAEKANQYKSDFLANVSHEIRTPMNAIVGLTHLSLKTDLNDKQQDYLKKINSSAYSLLGIINDILDFSKIEAGKFNLEIEEFQLEEVMDNLSNQLAYKAHDKGIELLFQIEPDVPNYLIGDSLRLSQVLINLLNNALKFTHEGEIVLTVSKSDSKAKNVILNFQVKDTGIGILKEEQEDLFLAFNQADTSTTRKYGGTGLGLSISRQLVEMMNGEISVKSKLGQGSTFYFTAEFMLQSEKTRKKLFVPSELNNLRLIIIDDNATSQKIIQSFLRNISVSVVAVFSAEEGIQELENAPKNNPYDIVIIDATLPGIDGITASQMIKNRKELTKIPAIILLSTFGMEEITQRIENTGIDAFLLKPINQSLLFDTIMYVLGNEDKKHEQITSPALMKTINTENIRGARILLVEDNKINQQIANELLNAEGMIVTLASNGKEAVAAIRNDNFDVVLMDIQMPIMDGYEATKRIRKFKSKKTLPIIAMTAHAMVGDKEKALEAGMDDHISKPIDPNDLFSTLINWVKKKNGISSVSKEVVEKIDISPSFPDLSGIDTKAGLYRIGGNPRAYGDILLKFKTNHLNDIDDIDSAVQKGDLENAKIITHTLKGAAGNIGAVELHKKISNFETVLSTTDYEDLKLDLSSVKESLESVFAAITENIVPKEIDNSTKTDKVEIIDVENFTEYLQELGKYIQENNTQAKSCLATLKTYVKNADNNTDWINLSSCIMNYNFDEALTVFNTIKEDLA
jgi:signal transduction histidine kinase/ABC-type amino acid transport substrate-binding protein/DNA-binding response OmpR family regulator/HPt (histidine-containing phosphotransfer) domain-containing protein